MSTIQVGLLGLGRVGSSVGLALKRRNSQKDARQTFVVSAYDPRPTMVSAAEGRGVADRFVRSAADAVRDKDIVVIALPYAEVAAAYRTMAPSLRSDAVILDASLLKLPSMEWARKHLPENVHTIGVTPIVNARYLYEGLDDAAHAAEDYFDDGVLLIMPDVRANADAVQLAVDFSAILGASSHFVDPVEHDGVAAATEGLPALLGVAMFRMLQQSDGWNDARRAGNPALGLLTHHLHDAHPDDLRDLLLLNRENMLHVLNAYIGALEEFRDVLARADRPALEEVIVRSEEAYRAWLLKRASNRWDDSQEASDAPRSAVMDGLLGSYLSKRLRGGKQP